MFKSPYLMIDEISFNTMIERSRLFESVHFSMDKLLVKQAGEESALNFNFKPVLQKDGSRALIQIDGPIVYDPTMLDKLLFSAVSTQEIMAAVADVAQDNQIESVVFAENTPGGEATKMHVLADMIYNLSLHKSTAAVNTGMMASAGYYIGSQTGKVFVEDKLNETGSIGTVTVLRDFSKAAEMSGVKVTKVATGPLKGAGIMGTPITADMIKMVQGKVDELQKGFSAAVERTRSEADMADGSEARSGQSFFADKAQELGLIDGVKSVEEVFNFLEQGNSFRKIKQSI
jgi:ClpP class serine protease